MEILNSENLANDTRAMIYHHSSTQSVKPVAIWVNIRPLPTAYLANVRGTFHPGPKGYHG